METILDAIVMFIFSSLGVYAILGPAITLQIIAILVMFIAHFLSETIVPVTQFPVLEFVDGWRISVSTTSIQLPYHIAALTCAFSAMAAVRRARPQSLAEAAMAGLVGIFVPPITFALTNIIIANINQIIAPLSAQTELDIWRIDMTSALPRLALLAVVSSQENLLLPIAMAIFLAGGYWGMALTFVMKAALGAVMIVGVPNAVMEAIYGVSSTDFRYVASALKKIALCAVAVILSVSSIQLQISAINTSAAATLALSRHFATNRVLEGINNLAIAGWENVLDQTDIDYIRNQPADNCESPSETGVAEHCSRLMSTIIANVVFSLLLPLLSIMLGISSGFMGWVFIDQLDPRKIIRDAKEDLDTDFRKNK